MTIQRALGSLTLIVLVASCVQTEVETFRRVQESAADEAFLKAGTDFSRYTKLLPLPLEIYYYEGQGEPDPSDLERVREIFRAAFADAIGEDYPIVQESGADVLGVRGSLVDLKLAPALGDLPVRGRAANLVANGQLTFFMELTDSVTGEVLAHAADQEKAADDQVAVPTAEVHWAETEKAARRWADMFRDFLDRNLGR